MHAPLPFGALLHQRVAAPHTSSQIEEMRGRDPRFWEAADQQQLAQMPSVSPVGFRALLAALQGAGLCGLRQVHVGTGALQFLDHKPPAGRRLQSNLETFALKAGQELPDFGSIGGSDPRAGDLAGDRVDPLRRDLGAMLIYPHHQRHLSPAPSTAQTSSTRPSAPRRSGHRIP